MKTKNIIMLALAGLALSLTGCAKMWNQAAADGGLFTSTTGTYIVRNESGGRIMDVWILRNVIVQEGEHGAGYLFMDDNGNSVHLGGDCRVMRMKNEADPLIQKYHEYHVEFQVQTYQELYSR